MKRRYWYLIMGAIWVICSSAVSADSAVVQRIHGDNLYYSGQCTTDQTSPATPAVASGTIVWPFSTKSSSQYNRVDQGWDIQSGPGANIYAIASGTIHQYAPNPGAFGNDFPTEQLDQSIGGPTSWVYYGHVHVIPSVVGHHVNAGQLIAHANTFDGENGSGAPPGWLEIGFADPGTDAPVDVPPIPTPAGQKMHDILISNGVQPAGNTTPTSPAAPTTQSGGCCSTSVSFGSGTLPSYVKEPYNSIFSAAAAKYNIDPALLVGIFYDEQYGFTNSVSAFSQHEWPNPPPPYGTGAPWATSASAGAEGPFQFLPGTFRTLGVSAHGGTKPNAEDLADAAFSAAHGFSIGGWGNIKITVSSSQTDITNAASYYYGSGAGIPNAYGQAAYTIYAKVKADEGQPTPGATTTSVANPSCSSNSGGSSNCGSASGQNAVILCQAEQYKGIFYSTSGHIPYLSFRSQCPLSSLSTAAQSSTAQNPGPCATDCSGLVSSAVDQAFNQNFMWVVSDIEKSPQLWEKISISSAQAGDVVTVTGTHVEIVDHINGNQTLVSFGAHDTGQKIGEITSPFSYWTGGAYRYIGPGSNGSG